MNTDQIKGLVKDVLLVGGGIAITKGYLTPENITDLINSSSVFITDVAALVGPIATIGGIVYGAWDRMHASVIAKAQKIVDKTGQVIAPEPKA